MGVYPFFTSASQGESAVTGGCAGVAWLVVSKFSIDGFNELMLPIPGRLFAHGWESSRLSLFQSVGAHPLGPSSINTKTNTLHGREKKKKIKREKPW